MGWKAVSRRRGELPADWVRLRERVLARCGGWCEWSLGCGERASHVDHIDRFGGHELSNLRGLCAHHHMVRTGRDGVAVQRARGRRRGRRVWSRWSRPHPGLRQP